MTAPLPSMGQRMPGQVYAMAGAIEWQKYLIDPPDTRAWDRGDVSSRLGVTYRYRENMKDIGDIHARVSHDDIDGYTYVPDYLEEGNRYGFGYPVGDNLDWSLLVPGKSRLVLSHARGSSHHPENLWTNRTQTNACPLTGELKLYHQEQKPHHDWMCISMLWEMIGNAQRGSRTQTRNRNTFSYRCWRPPSSFQAGWRTATFIAFPVDHLEVIQDSRGGVHELIVQKLKRKGSQYPIMVVKE